MQVQEEMARRSEKYSNSGKRSRYSANHAFTQIVFCANCGAIFKRLHWSNRGKKTIVWRCSTRLANKEACAARTIREEELQEGFLIAVREIIKNSGEYIRILNENLELAIHQANPESVENLDARMAELQHELIDRTERHENIDELAEELLRLRELRSQTVMDDAAKNEHQKRIKELQAFIRSQQKGLEFDETLVRHLLERVTVFPDNLLFTFRSGVTVTVEK